MWSLRWYFTNKSVTGAPYSIKSYSLSHSWTLWWRVRWLKQCRLEVTAELQQWWRRTNRRWKSIIYPTVRPAWWNVTFSCSCFSILLQKISQWSVMELCIYSIGMQIKWMPLILRLTDASINSVVRHLALLNGCVSMVYWKICCLISVSSICVYICMSLCFLQCFDTVGWASGRASGL